MLSSATRGTALERAAKRGSASKGQRSFPDASSDFVDRLPRHLHDIAVNNLDRRGQQVLILLHCLQPAVAEDLGHQVSLGHKHNPTAWLLTAAKKSLRESLGNMIVWRLRLILWNPQPQTLSV